MEFINQLPSTILGWLTLIGIIAVGAVAVYGVFDKALREKRKEAAEASDDLVAILKETVDQLGKKVSELEEEQEHLTKEVAALKTENQTLVKVLQGRDDRTVEFQNQVLDAVKISRETNEIVKKMGEGFSTFVPAMEKLTMVLEGASR